MKKLIITTALLLSTSIFSKEYIVKIKEINSIQNEFEIIRHIARDFYLVKSDKKINAFFSPEENAEVRTLYRPQDPMLEIQWGHENLGNNEPRRGGGRIPIPGVLGADSDIFNAWNITTGNKKVIIAVIDTGVDHQHKDLKRNMWTNSKELNGKAGVDDDGNGYIDDVYGYDFFNGDGDPMDDNFHGTHVAGIIGAVHNNEGIAGVMKDVSIMGIKFMDHKGRGKMDKALEALYYAIDNGAKILNNSWGTLQYSKAFHEAIEEANKRGVLFVAASGNNFKNNDKEPRYPANYDSDNVITVAAYNPENRLTGWSCYGKKTVHLAAPGRNIMSTIPKNKYKVLSGTSQAAPYVAGALGLFLSLENELTPKEIKRRLIQTSTPVEHLFEKVESNGRLSIGNFITY